MVNPRQLARQRAVQALYSWQLTEGDPGDIDAEFRIDNDMDGVDVDYFRELLREIPRLREELDAHIVPLLPRPLDEVDPVELAILRLGAYELKCRLDVPWRVAINEGVELAKLFGAEQGHRFVNGILDGLARELRSVEQAADTRPIPEPAAPAGVTVGKGKYGQKRAPVIMTASKKKTARKRIVKKAAESTTARKTTVKADEKAPAKKAASRKPVVKKATVKEKVVARKPAREKRPAGKKVVKKSGASLYAGKKKPAS